jgi:hypothetical protein
MKPLKQRFNEKVVTGPVHKCWHWAGAINGDGYGNMKVGGVALGAHRISYELHHSPIPDGMHVMHKCDNPACVNPAHLKLGTHLDNMKDMYSKGRRKAAAKLSSDDVKQVVNGNASAKVLSLVFGVSSARINQLRRAHARQLNS